MIHLSRSLKIVFTAIAALLIISFGVIAWKHTDISPSAHAQLQVVAGENFWGSLVSQLGGSRVHVTSIVTDPNADPHEQATSNANARAFATADYVILNGAGYDSWGDHLLSTGGSAHRRVLKVSDLLGKKDGDNPHFWYNPSYVNQTIDRMEQDLISLSPQDTSYFKKQAATLHTRLATYQGQIAQIKQKYAGTKVAATEDIFAYLSNAAGLNLISPLAFTEAVAEGNDPSTNSVAAFQQQLQSGQVQLLVYNQQTVTPLTTSMKQIATAHHIPVIGITETIQPVGASFEDWMSNQLTSLQKALSTQEAHS